VLPACLTFTIRDYERSSYLQVDVIDAAFGKLRESLMLENSGDFESVVAAHAEFLTVVSAQCVSDKQYLQAGSVSRFP